MKDNKEETEEKPKAVVEMEENSDAGKAKKRIEEKKEQDAKTANKKFIIKYIIFICILLIITAGAIWLSIKQLNKDEEELHTQEIISVDKPEAEDSKYAVNSYNETYNENSLKIQYYAGNDQPVEKTHGGEEYAQIEGLLNKDIQNSINKRLKETAKKLKEGNRRTFSDVTANFGNVLSVYIQNEDSKVETINIDLTTGNDIPIEDVFVSSAPLNSYIMEGVFESLAWDKLNSNYETIFGRLDMNNVDTSEYEDIALKVVNNYKTKGKNVKYYITTTGIRIYEITDKSMYNLEYGDFSNIGIDFLGRREDVAIYKRYLTTKSIFENDSIGGKNIIVFTDNIYDDKYMYNLAYGQEDNVFVEEALIYYANELDKDNSSYEAIKNYLKNKINEDKQRIKSQTDKNMGAFYQKEVQLTKSENYYCASIIEYQATCDISYFKDEAFKDYAKMQNESRNEVGMNAFTEYNKDEYPNLIISNMKTSEMYFDLEGNFIGTTEAEAKEKTKTEKKEVTTEKNTVNENTTNTTTTNTTINENKNEVNNNIVNETKVENNVIEN